MATTDQIPVVKTIYRHSASVSISGGYLYFSFYSSSNVPIIALSQTPFDFTNAMYGTMALGLRQEFIGPAVLSKDLEDSVFFYTYFDPEIGSWSADYTVVLTTAVSDSVSAA